MPAAWCGLVLALPVAALWAQGPGAELRPTPDIELFQASRVQALLPLVDGGTVVAGNFTAINGLRREGLARLQVDGRIDPQWRPDLIGSFQHLLELPDGSLIAAGLLVDYENETATSGLTRLTADGAEIPGSRVATTGQILALALAADGGVFAGGAFSRIAGQAQPYLAKLRIGQSITLDPDWQPAPEHRVTALMVDDRGDLIVGGGFNLIAGQYRGGLAKVSAHGTGALDPDWRPLPDHFVSHLAPGPDSSVMVAGYFSQIGGQSRRRLAKLSTLGTGRADPAWNATADWSPVPAASESIYALASAKGWLYVGGGFSQIGGLDACCVARLSVHGTGAADPAWVAPPMRPFAVVSALAVAPGGDLFLGGDLRTEQAAASLGLAHLDRDDGRIVAPMWVAAPGQVDRIGLQPDGGAIVAGRFDLADGQYRENLLRVTAQGGVDPAWRPSVQQGVRLLQIDAAGDVFLGGWFEQVDGVARRYLAKLSGTGSGSVQPGWAPDPDDHVFALAIEPGGSLLVGGRFEVIDGRPRRFLARIQGNGVVDPDWTPTVADWVSALALDRQGRVLVGAGTLRRFDPGSGAIDAGWRPLLPRSHQLAIDAAGQVYSAFNFQQEQLRTTSLSAVSATATGELPPLWTRELFGSTRQLLPSTAGGMLAAGEFGRENPFRLDEALLGYATDGAPTPQHLPDLDRATHALAGSSDGSLWIGGAFVTADGAERLGLARFGAASGAVPARAVALSPVIVLAIAVLAWLAAWRRHPRGTPPAQPGRPGPGRRGPIAVADRNPAPHRCAEAVQ